MTNMQRVGRTTAVAIALFATLAFSHATRYPYDSLSSLAPKPGINPAIMR